MNEALAVIDTQRIHEYVFGGTELAMFRGASRLLSECTVTEWKRLIGECGGEEVFCGGGNALALFPTTEAGKRFCRKAVQALERSTKTANAIWQVEKRRAGEAFPGNAGNGWRDRALRALNDRKYSGSAPVWGEAHPYGKFCEACGARSAVHERERGARASWFCEACLAKSSPQRGYWFDQFEGFIRREGVSHPGWENLPESPRDLSVIGECSRPAGYLAFVYLDINELGKLFRNVDVVQDQAGYKALSEAVEESTHMAVMTSLADVLRPAEEESGRIVPFEIFLVGGDDALLVTPAHRAMDLVERFLQVFEEKFASRRVGPAPKVSAGVVYAHSRFPVRMAIDHAERLLRGCKIKGHADREHDHMVDYMAITNAVEMPVSDLRAQQYKGQAGRKLVSRPLRWREFQEIRDLCGILTELPRTRVRALYDLMFGGYYQSTLDFCEWMSRLEAPQKDKLSEFFSKKGMFACPFDKEGNSPILDAIELLEFRG